ncbi:MAG: M3 family oligoendopeptidase [Candidatus Eremiobacteraeota bacterium]|nr:M3 family oligoendopeptidase [Candidatus Eremiobacteraeota bacterium]
MLRRWDALRRDVHTRIGLTNLRFDQDTADPAARAARTAIDELKPKLTALDHAMKGRFMRDEVRGRVEPAIGPQAFRKWDCDLAAFAPQIEADLVAEAELVTAYTATIAAVSVEFRGERLNLSGLLKYATDPDRSVRHAAFTARWEALGERGEELDRIYGELVRVRDRIARTLGYGSFTALGYRRMHRIGYGVADVERWRDAIVAQVVPVASVLVARAARLLGIERVALWDEKFLAGPERVAPLSDPRSLMERTIAGFDRLDPQLGSFARMMERRQLNDLATRGAKRAGAYCTFLASYDVPFIFANSNGTRDDVKTLMHELGHAFQAYRSRELPVLDYVTPTLEAAEVHSMSLEYLSWPVMDGFFGDGADDYRQGHLADAMLFLPYGVAVDHFQHLVYERPDATPEERHAMWRWVEQRYLPWRTYGDLARPANGAFWQSQLHVYSYPFYYVDYTFALCCALQFWAASQSDFADAMRRYVELCGRGGSASFTELVASAGLLSPFEPAALHAVVARAREALAA